MAHSPTTICIINHKGGTAKTTTTVHIAAALAKKDKRVLAIDLDTQANLTHWLIGDVPKREELSITEAILDKSIPISQVIRKTNIKNLDLAPAGESMVNLELNLTSRTAREHLLRIALDKIKGSYDYIILDNPPNIGLTTINALVASDYFLVPVSCEYLPMVGIKHLLNTIEEIQPVNEKLRNLGYLLTMVDRRESITADVEEILRGQFSNDVFKTVVRINTKLKACPQKKQTIFDVESSEGRGYQDYMNVGKELLKRMEAMSGAR